MTLRDRIRRRDPLLGSFVKTPASYPIEIAALVGLDFVVLDAEHAPFSFEALDRCLLASRAVTVPAIVRIPELSKTYIQQVLDLGGAGILVPHVTTAHEARAAVAAARFAGGHRGYSNSTRAGEFGGRGMADYLEQGDANAAVIVQIEDRIGVENAREIAAVPGLDGIFIGRADLAVDLGAPASDDAAVAEAVVATAEAAVQAGTACGIFLPDVSEAPACFRLGMNFFVVGSDQSMLRAAWSRASTAFGHQHAARN